MALDPSLFTAGSCVAYGPTGGNRHLTVFLDAGHGGIDPGAIGVTTGGRTITEAAQTLPVELDAMALLRAQGFRVVVSRTRAGTVARLGPADVSGGTLTLAGELREVGSRDVCANLAHANVLIGIYFDSAASPQAAGSIAAYDTVRSFATKSLRLATLVQDDVLAAMNAHGWQIPNAGVRSDYTLGGPPLSAAAARYHHLLLLGPAMAGYFSTPSTMPGTIVEPLFLTDPFEATVAASKAGQQAIAQGIARAVDQYFAASGSGSRSPSGSG